MRRLSNQGKVVSSNHVDTASTRSIPPNLSTSSFKAHGLGRTSKYKDQTPFLSSRTSPRCSPVNSMSLSPFHEECAATNAGISIEEGTENSTPLVCIPLLPPDSGVNGSQSIPPRLTSASQFTTSDVTPCGGTVKGSAMALPPPVQLGRVDGEGGKNGTVTDDTCPLPSPRSTLPVRSTFSGHGPLASVMSSSLVPISSPLPFLPPPPPAMYAFSSFKLVASPEGIPKPPLPLSYASSTPPGLEEGGMGNDSSPYRVHEIRENTNDSVRTVGRVGGDVMDLRHSGEGMIAFRQEKTEEEREETKKEVKTTGSEEIHERRGEGNSKGSEIKEAHHKSEEGTVGIPISVPQTICSPSLEPYASSPVREGEKVLLGSLVAFSTFTGAAAEEDSSKSGRKHETTKRRYRSGATHGVPPPPPPRRSPPSSKTFPNEFSTSAFPSVVTHETDASLSTSLPRYGEVAAAERPTTIYHTRKAGQEGRGKEDIRVQGGSPYLSSSASLLPVLPTAATTMCSPSASSTGLGSFSPQEKWQRYDTSKMTEEKDLQPDEKREGEKGGGRGWEANVHSRSSREDRWTDGLATGGSPPPGVEGVLSLGKLGTLLSPLGAPVVLPPVPPPLPDERGSERRGLVGGYPPAVTRSTTSTPIPSLSFTTPFTPDPTGMEKNGGMASLRGTTPILVGRTPALTGERGLSPEGSSMAAPALPIPGLAVFPSSFSTRPADGRSLKDRIQPSTTVFQKKKIALHQPRRRIGGVSTASTSSVLSRDSVRRTGGGRGDYPPRRRRRPLSSASSSVSSAYGKSSKAALLSRLVVVCFVMLFLKGVTRTLTHFREEKDRIASMPKAAFIIQCCFRRYRQRVRIQRHQASRFLGLWFRFHYQRMLQSKEQSVLLLQRVFRGERDRSFCFFMYHQMKRNRAVHIMRKFVQRWEAKNTLDDVRAARDERNVLIGNFRSAILCLLREEREGWLRIAQEGQQTLQCFPLTTIQDWAEEVLALTSYHPVLCTAVSSGATSPLPEPLGNFSLLPPVATANGVRPPPVYRIDDTSGKGEEESLSKEERRWRRLGTRGVANAFHRVGEGGHGAKRSPTHGREGVASALAMATPAVTHPRRSVVKDEETCVDASGRRRSQHSTVVGVEVRESGVSSARIPAFSTPIGETVDDRGKEPMPPYPSEGAQPTTEPHSPKLLSSASNASEKMMSVLRISGSPWFPAFNASLLMYSFDSGVISFSGVAGGSRVVTGSPLQVRPPLQDEGSRGSDAFRRSQHHWNEDSPREKETYETQDHTGSTLPWASPLADPGKIGGKRPHPLPFTTPSSNRNPTVPSVLHGRPHQNRQAKGEEDEQDVAKGGLRIGPTGRAKENGEAMVTSSSGEVKSNWARISMATSYSSLSVASLSFSFTSLLHAELSFQRLFFRSYRKGKGMSKAVPLLQRLSPLKRNAYDFLQALFPLESSDYLNCLFPIEPYVLSFVQAVENVIGSPFCGGEGHDFPACRATSQDRDTKVRVTILGGLEDDEATHNGPPPWCTAPPPTFSEEAAPRSEHRTSDPRQPRSPPRMEKQGSLSPISIEELSSFHYGSFLRVGVSGEDDPHSPSSLLLKHKDRIEKEPLRTISEAAEAPFMRHEPSTEMDQHHSSRPTRSTDPQGSPRPSMALFCPIPPSSAWEDTRQAGIQIFAVRMTPSMVEAEGEPKGEWPNHPTEGKEANAADTARVCHVMQDTAHPNEKGDVKGEVVESKEPCTRDEEAANACPLSPLPPRVPPPPPPLSVPPTSTTDLPQSRTERMRKNVEKKAPYVFMGSDCAIRKTRSFVEGETEDEEEDQMHALSLPRTPFYPTAPTSSHSSPSTSPPSPFLERGPARLMDDVRHARERPATGIPYPAENRNEERKGENESEQNGTLESKSAVDQGVEEKGNRRDERTQHLVQKMGLPSKRRNRQMGEGSIRGVLAAFRDTLIRTESIERQQLQRTIMEALRLMLRPLELIHLTLHFASTSVPPLFSDLLLEMKDAGFLQRAARLFSTERRCRLMIMEEYAKVPLQHLVCRPLLNPLAEWSTHRALCHPVNSFPSPAEIAKNTIEYERQFPFHLFRMSTEEKHHNHLLCTDNEDHREEEEEQHSTNDTSVQETMRTTTTSWNSCGVEEERTRGRVPTTTSFTTTMAHTPCGHPPATTAVAHHAKRKPVRIRMTPVDITGTHLPPSSATTMDGGLSSTEEITERHSPMERRLTHVSSYHFTAPRFPTSRFSFLSRRLPSSETAVECPPGPTKDSQAGASEETKDAFCSFMYSPHLFPPPPPPRPSSTNNGGSGVVPYIVLSSMPDPEPCVSLPPLAPTTPITSSSLCCTSRIPAGEELCSLLALSSSSATGLHQGPRKDCITEEKGIKTSEKEEDEASKRRSSDRLAGCLSSTTRVIPSSSLASQKVLEEQENTAGVVEGRWSMGIREEPTEMVHRERCRSGIQSMTWKEDENVNPKRDFTRTNGDMVKKGEETLRQTEETAPWQDPPVLVVSRKVVKRKVRWNVLGKDVKETEVGGREVDKNGSFMATTGECGGEVDHSDTKEFLPVVPTPSNCVHASPGLRRVPLPVMPPAPASSKKCSNAPISSFCHAYSSCGASSHSHPLDGMSSLSLSSSSFSHDPARIPLLSSVTLPPSCAAQLLPSPSIEEEQRRGSDKHHLDYADMIRCNGPREMRTTPRERVKVIHEGKERRAGSDVAVQETIPVPDKVGRQAQGSSEGRQGGGGWAQQERERSLPPPDGGNTPPPLPSSPVSRADSSSSFSSAFGSIASSTWSAIWASEESWKNKGVGCVFHLPPPAGPHDPYGKKVGPAVTVKRQSYSRGPSLYEDFTPMMKNDGALPSDLTKSNKKGEEEIGILFAAPARVPVSSSLSLPSFPPPLPPPRQHLTFSENLMERFGKELGVCKQGSSSPSILSARDEEENRRNETPEEEENIMTEEDGGLDGEEMPHIHTTEGEKEEDSNESPSSSSIPSSPCAESEHQNEEV